MKAQCVHSDTGLCLTCFNYECTIAKLKESSWNTGDAFCCEQHPNLPWEHKLENGSWCPGPGMPDARGRVTITSLRTRILQLEEALRKLKSSIECRIYGVSVDKDRRKAQIEIIEEALLSSQPIESVKEEHEKS